MAQAIISLGLLGLVFGGLLGFAAKVFAVPVDERAEAIKRALPGANCGACGFPGCSGLAEAIARGEADFNACPVGGGVVAGQIAEIMGLEAGEAADTIPRKAKFLCRGGKNECRQAFVYEGLPDCRAADIQARGGKACPYACLGFGNCVRACPFGGIRMNANGLPEIDTDLCTACGQCVAACPKGLLKLMPETAVVYVTCSSRAPAREVNKACAVGCIACRICEKACPFDAIKVENNLAVIDYEKCRLCGLCAEKCPKKIIIDARPVRSKAVIDGEACIGCGLCKKVCPVDAIAGEMKQPHRVDPQTCITCRLCVEKCPKNAINMVQQEG